MSAITKEQFLDYERVRVGGKTNMFDVRRVEALSRCLNRDLIMQIMKEYSSLREKYLPERKTK